MIPLEALAIIWLAAMTSSFSAAIVIFRRHRRRLYARRSMAYAMLAYGGGSAGIVTFYCALLFTEIRSDPIIAVTWSRWAFSVMGIIVTVAGIAAYIVNKRV
jgi:hypothetical protein